jgi:hypothetical protein
MIKDAGSIVTKFMKDLSKEEVDAIIKYCELFENKLEKANQDIKAIVDAEPNAKFKSLYYSSKSKSKNGVFHYHFISGFVAAFCESFIIGNERYAKVSYATYLQDDEFPSKATAQKLIDLEVQINNNIIPIDRDIEQIAFKTNFLSSSSSGSILIGQASIYFEEFQKSDFDYGQKQYDFDMYTHNAYGTYLWQYIFNKYSGSIPLSNIKNYIATLNNETGKQYPRGEHRTAGPLLYDTFIGQLIRYRAIKEKLKDYDPVTKTMKNGYGDSVEDVTGITEATNVETFLARYAIDFSLTSELTSKYGASLGDEIDVYKQNFYRILQPNDSFVEQNEKYIRNIWNKIKTSGLLDLALSAGSISDFARQRFSIGKDLVSGSKGSAAYALDPVRDTMWLNDLSQAVTNLTRDPITLAIIQQYFPTLTTFFFNALAVSADYNPVTGSQDDPINNPDELAKSLLRAFGTDENGDPIFTAAWEFINTGQRIRAALEEFPFRENIPPKTPDIFHFRLGASNFYVPPVSIDVSSHFKTGSLTGGAIRQKSSPKFNAGYKQTSVNVKLFFPNYEEIWGISIEGIKEVKLTKDFKIDFKTGSDTTEEQIDKFLSSLRGLVAAFKYAPILPVKNHYLNTVHGITGVALSSMSISTIPNYPFALVVDLELLNFNHKPFLPMLKDFNQAVHWGKFRHYMGKAAGSLHSYINESFFVAENELEDSLGISLPQVPQTAGGNYNQNVVDYVESALTPTPVSKSSIENLDEPDLIKNPFENDVLTTNVIKEWKNGNNISLFIPAQTQTKIFTPDTSSFRSEEEKGLDDLGESAWNARLKSIGIDINESAGYHRGLSSVAQTAQEGSISPSARRVVLESIELIVAGNNKKEFNEKIYTQLVVSFIIENKQKLNDQEIAYLKILPSENPDNNYTSRERIFTFKNKDMVRNPDYTNPINYNLYEVRELFKKSSASTTAYLDSLAFNDAKEKSDRTGKPVSDFLEQSKEDMARAFNVLFYNRFFKTGPIQQIMEQYRLRNSRMNNDGGMFGNGTTTFAEWEVPMIKVDLDPKHVIVNGVSVTLGNNLAKMQLQMQEEPTYQHIGGKDTYMNISMTVFGEKELIKIRKVFEHINGLARLEHSTGVIGFMGIKNIVAGLAGVKYVMPLSYEVNTIPNYPHVYDVKISFVDFDIFQQQKEQLSSKQQRDMVETFGTKRNPFLRIKQLWGAFNAYPDFPLAIKDKNGETVGCLDPDYYFRSFEMFDQDIINNVTLQTEKNKDFVITPKKYDKKSTADSAKEDVVIMDTIKLYIQNDQISELKTFFEEEGIGPKEAISYIEGAIKEFSITGKEKLLTDYIDQFPETDGSIAVFGTEYAIGTNATGIKLSLGAKDGQAISDGIISSDSAKVKELQDYLSGVKSSGDEDGYVSFNPDDLGIHHIVSILPAQENVSDDKIPAMFTTAQGYHLGYMSKKNNLFYMTIDSMEVVKRDDGKGVGYKPIAVPHSDVDSPDRSYSKAKGAPTHTGVPGSTLANHGNPYSNGSSDTPETMAKETSVPSTTKHWEKMLIDTQYRDVSGRMVRAFPTYMLWLIDEGGYFAGVKLFDNFYGLQSIIDFSIVQSEDILGDTLILRVSNLYSKLTTPESTSLFGSADQTYNTDAPTATEGIGGALDTILNRARNMVNHMDSTYVVNINNIRLKPGVRVHLRAGYGANPNGLQTVFNGTITQVENGEIVTITAQSDAIELSPVVNSTNKKGDSGKIDGGINTGFWLSEPRDLMVRLLSMGTSRTREAIAHATRGTIFSENKFGIRHFGNILYAPLNDMEQAKNDAVTASVKDAFDSMGNSSGNFFGAGSALGVLSSGTNEGSGSLFGIGPEVRVPGISLMKTLWANFSTQRDFEIFKRNIYPGNGTGIAQFLGGDLGDGWATVASLTPEDKPNEKINYIGRLTDYSWNNLTTSYGQGQVDASQVMDAYNSDKGIGNSNGGAQIAQTIMAGALGVAGVATLGLGAPIIGGIAAGAGLTGVLSGRGGTNVFNAMGITSGRDDDLPGLDEVSFRAQTYMRSVWDLFQLCARLLPNYIVAVRPFEDRSTVFYGKPHWLYTSGVVPLTTGFPSADRAAALGINSPRDIDIDTITQQTMDSINKESNPFADAAAFRAANTSIKTVESIVSEQGSSFTDTSDSDINNAVYAPGKSLFGKIIQFGAKSSMTHTDKDGNITKLPTHTGYATVGYHLPIVDVESTIVANADNAQLAKHRQIDQLPYRYRFPFFTDREDGIALEDYAYYSLSEDLGKWNNHKADYMTLSVDDWSYGKVGGEKGETEWVKLLKAEQSITMGVNTVDYGNSLNSNEMTISLKLNLGASLIFKGNSEASADEYIYSDKNKTLLGSERVIRMPYPDKSQNLPDTITRAATEYSILKKTTNASKNAASMLEWGAPTKPDEEQFYIAMRWPYEPGSGVEGIDKDTVADIKNRYGLDEVSGSASDYKKRKVLVYSPTTGQAVVCHPAYFLWGKEDVGVLGKAFDEFGNIDSTDTTSIGTEGGRTNNFGLETRQKLEAVVSPDAAYFLGMLNLTAIEKKYWSDGAHSKAGGSWHEAEAAITESARSGVAPYPVPRECLYAFVPDSTPLGVLPELYLPAKEFEKPTGGKDNGNKKIIGFGKFSKTTTKVNSEYSSKDVLGQEENFFELTATEKPTSSIELTGTSKIGGNILGAEGLSTGGYFDLVKAKSFDQLSASSLKTILDEETKNSGKDKLDTGRKQFVGVYTETDMVSINARKYYDEDYDQATGVIAGDGRTLSQAADIWDQFRFGYHTYANVKLAFQNAYGLDPDSEDSLFDLGSLGEALGMQSSFGGSAAAAKELFSGTGTFEEASALYKQRTQGSKPVSSTVFDKYGDTGNSAQDEFTTVFGPDFFKSTTVSSAEKNRGASTISGEKIKEALELSRQKFIDGSIENDGLIEYFNSLISGKVESIKSLIVDGLKLAGISEADIDSYLKTIETPKQLFLFVVGAFRNAMWSDAYARAWLVLKPNRKMAGKDQWDFNPVLKIFQAYIDPNSDYAKNTTKFRKLLAENRGEGSSATNVAGRAGEAIDNFWDANVGPLFTALGDGLSGLINIFRMSMMQLGYGLDQVGNMSKQANILNKALNDSIYYSLGRPGSLLRAVDNPFTREYGEPVVEIREPFQRMHYISSFSHIISNGIQENISGVATSITAVSDGKYPVTVAMDKSTPAERQVEKTVETGIYYDNATGSGLFGALHPILHPFEFARGISKLAQGTPDELVAKRIGLSHLKDSLKDIYGGEIVVMGNADIRPHDIVYLADVYERMYGMFEVEQVVHHFTSELGFITSITPNAMVTVNDPSRWFMSSWMGTWFHMQALRNDTRLYMNSLGSGVAASGQVSVDGLADSLQTQMIGGIQYTHGSAALAKDAMSTYTAEGFADINKQVKDLVSNSTSAVSGGQVNIGGLGRSFSLATGLGATVGAVAALAVPGAGLLAGSIAAGIGGYAGGGLAWKGWSWIRDNVLDQHGCYIQYLNKNGQAMDAGLNQSGQGMVVGRYHTKKLLPGILGVATKVRTPEGNSYIRTDDLLKSLGWREKEINDLTRYISLENAMVNAQVLKYSGVGPEKAGLNRFFKIICRVTNVRDGDTIDVVDIFDSEQREFGVRFDAINTPELNVIKTDTSVSAPKTVSIESIQIVPGGENGLNLMIIRTPVQEYLNDDDIAIVSIPNYNGANFKKSAKIITASPRVKIEDYENDLLDVYENIPKAFVIETSLPLTNITNVSNATATVHGYDSTKFSLNKSAGGKSALFTQNALKDKIIILRVSPDKKKATATIQESDFEAGTEKNKYSKRLYNKDVYSRILGTIFYKTSLDVQESLSLQINNLFIKNIKLGLSPLKTALKNSLYNDVFVSRFNEIYEAVQASSMNEGAGDYINKYAKNNSTLMSMSAEQKQAYNTYYNIRILQNIYDNVSDWPNISWDEYYEDGTPASLNWELVVNGLAKVDTKGLLIEQDSVFSAEDQFSLYVNALDTK